MADSGPRALGVLGLEVISLGDGCFFIASVAPVELFLIGSLVIDQVLGINKFVVLEHLDLSDGESTLHVVAFGDVVEVIDEGGVDIGARLPEGADQEHKHEGSEDSEDQMVCVFVKEILFLFGAIGLSHPGSLSHLRVGIDLRGALLGRLGSCHLILFYNARGINKK